MSKAREAVSASAAKHTAGKGKLDDIRIEPTDNGGVIVTESRRSTKKTGDYPSYTPPSRMAFASSEEALAYVKTCLGK